MIPSSAWSRLNKAARMIITPWWDSNGLCMDYLETGDVVEVLPNPDYPITMNGMTYHPQTEALLQWFEGMTPSDATGGAYSYPDTSILTTANPPTRRSTAASSLILP